MGSVRDSLSQLVFAFNIQFSVLQPEDFTSFMTAVIDDKVLFYMFKITLDIFVLYLYSRVQGFLNT